MPSITRAEPRSPQSPPAAFSYMFVRGGCAAADVGAKRASSAPAANMPVTPERRVIVILLDRTAGVGWSEIHVRPQRSAAALSACCRGAEPNGQRPDSRWAHGYRRSHSAARQPGDSMNTQARPTITPPTSAMTRPTVTSMAQLRTGTSLILAGVVAEYVV